MSKNIKIGLLGYGTVGQGVANLLLQNQIIIKSRTGYDVSIIAIAKRNWKDIDQPEWIDCTTDAMSVVNNPDVNLLIELIGGEDEAFNLVSTAIKNGKNVITANKALIAKKGKELFALAKEHNVRIGFEAAVAGGIPIIKSLKEGLAGNEIQSIAGIINGTSNYILSAMRNEGKDFAEALAEAQRLGYAETDPTFDIEGIDAAHKLAILASIGFGVDLSFDEIAIEGITQISKQDVEYAEKLGYRIKHLGIAMRRKSTESANTTSGNSNNHNNDYVEIRVHPTLVPISCLMSKVDGVKNAVRVFDNAVGESIYYGAGAGSLPTASSVISDIISIINTTNENNVNPLGFIDKNSQIKILPKQQHKSANYLRMTVVDEVGVLASIATILSEKNISIEALIQKEPIPPEKVVPIVILTQSVNEESLQEALSAIKKLPSLQSDIKRIRVAHF